MSKKKSTDLLPDNEIVEVVMRKEMPYRAYKGMILQAKQKGWSILAYQKGFCFKNKNC